MKSGLLAVSSLRMLGLGAAGVLTTAGAVSMFLEHPYAALMQEAVSSRRVNGSNDANDGGNTDDAKGGESVSSASGQADTNSEEEQEASFFSQFQLPEFFSSSPPPSHSPSSYESSSSDSDKTDGMGNSPTIADGAQIAGQKSSRVSFRELGIGNPRKSQDLSGQFDDNENELNIDIHGVKYRLATWGQRFIAHMYNALIMLARQVVLMGLPTLALRSFFGSGAKGSNLDNAISGLTTMGLIAYQGVIELAIDSDTWPVGWGGSKNGQNLGMRWVGICLIREDGLPVDMQTMMWWWLGWMLAPVNVITGALDSRNQSLDNHLSGTYVVMDET